MGTVVRTVCRIANLVFHFCFFLFPLLVILFGFIESMRKIDVHYERNVGIRTKNILQFILYLRSVNKRGEVKKKKKTEIFSTVHEIFGNSLQSEISMWLRFISLYILRTLGDLISSYPKCRGVPSVGPKSGHNRVKITRCEFAKKKNDSNRLFVELIDVLKQVLE